MATWFPGRKDWIAVKGFCSCVLVGIIYTGENDTYHLHHGTPANTRHYLKANPAAGASPLMKGGHKSGTNGAQYTSK